MPADLGHLWSRDPVVKHQRSVKRNGFVSPAHTDWIPVGHTRNVSQLTVVFPWVLSFSSAVRYFLVQCYGQGRETTVLEEVTIKRGY